MSKFFGVLALALAVAGSAVAANQAAQAAQQKPAAPAAQKPTNLTPAQEKQAAEQAQKYRAAAAKARKEAADLQKKSDDLQKQSNDLENRAKAAQAAAARYEARAMALSKLVMADSLCDRSKFLAVWSGLSDLRAKAAASSIAAAKKQLAESQADEKQVRDVIRTTNNAAYKAQSVQELKRLDDLQKSLTKRITALDEAAKAASTRAAKYKADAATTKTQANQVRPGACP